ncbi:DUF3299 domain-containing protein [Dyadobacter sp. CY351]|uniref:DUF3299 domain-containing protein n=1 Tax=Dyadobacter sp. CY351 TaxID=2909337 RepID=UPI001F325694|nr:DUF3299 domain-containing protein [Dyadobacter sp. CY351]MCF2517161.1 DUF3299 domain-containing protein [Dyadobacter sp. CY351]
MKIWIFTAMLLCSVVSFADERSKAINWKHLSDVRFSRKFNKVLDMYFLYPDFGRSVKDLEGKKVAIKGYMIPVDPDGNIYVISAQPMSMCFFCGGAGPESIVELKFRDKKQRFKTDAVKTVTGTLKLNSQDVEHLNYILEDASVSGQ